MRLKQNLWLPMRAVLCIGAVLLLCAWDLALESGDPRVEELIAAARGGNAEAQYRLSGLLEQGYGDLKADRALADTLLQRASEAGLPAAQNLLGYRLYTGEGMEPDTVRGMELMEQSAKAGDARAANNLGYLLIRQGRQPEGLEWLGKAAEQGLPAAQTQLADMLLHGEVTEADTVAAVKWYDKAISQGFRDAELKLMAFSHRKWAQMEPEEALELGRLYYNHNGLLAGVSLFEIAADKGNMEAMALLGDAYSRGRGVEYDHGKSLQFFYQAALGGNPSAQYVVAELLDMFPDALEDLPAGLERINDAQEWYRRAAKGGVRDAEEASRRLLHPDDEKILKSK